jgi:hypothetical protein
MKIRHKPSGLTLEGGFVNDCGFWRDQHAVIGQRSQYWCEEWERVPEERWVDVTAECTWRGHRLYHKRELNGTVILYLVQDYGDYRIRRVRYKSIAFVEDNDVPHTEAFIIERKECC